MIVVSLKEKYKNELIQVQSILDNNYLKGKYQNGGVFDSDYFLFSRWAYKVEKGWYGFSLDDIPFTYCLIINDFLHWLVGKCPNFKIHQIKIKYGGLRFYVDLASNDETLCGKIRDEIVELENLIYHKNLIY